MEHFYKCYYIYLEQTYSLFFTLLNLILIYIIQHKILLHCVYLLFSLSMCVYIVGMTFYDLIVICYPFHVNYFTTFLYNYGMVGADMSLP